MNFAGIAIPPIQIQHVLIVTMCPVLLVFHTVCEAVTAEFPSWTLEPNGHFMHTMHPNIVHKFSKGCILRHRHPCEDPQKDVHVSGKSARIHVKILASPVSVLWNAALMPQP